MHMAIVRSIKVEIMEPVEGGGGYQTKDPPEYREITNHELIGKHVIVQGTSITSIQQEQC